MKLSEMLSYPIKNTPFFPRPLWFLSAVFLCSLFFIKLSALSFLIFSALIASYALFLAVTDKVMGRFKNPLPYLMLTALLLAAALSMTGIINYHRLSKLEGEVTVKAVISDDYYVEQFGSLYRAELMMVDGESVSGNAEVFFTSDPMLSVYDTVTIAAEVSDAREGMSFFELLSAKSADICLTVEVKEVLNISNESRTGVSYGIYTLRSLIGNQLECYLEPKTASYAKALLIGDTDGLGTTFRSDMSALGISHIIAVSGMHMSIIAMLITFLADRFKTSRKLKSILLIAGGLAFTAIAGFSPSVIRAFVMMTVGLLAVFFGGKGDPLTSLALSGVIICTVEPNNAISCSFLLSFFATLGIVLCALYAERASASRLYSSRVGDMRFAYRAIRKLLLSLAVTLCATLFTVPVLSLYFSEMSFFSFIMNLIAIPMAFVSMLLALLTLAFGGVGFLGAIVCGVFDNLYTVFESVIHFAARSFSTSVSLLYPFFVPCLILLLSAMIFFWIARVRNPLAVISAFLIVAIVYAASVQVYNIANSDRGEVSYFATEGSEGLLVNSGTSTMYVDIGNGSKGVSMLGLEEATERYCETALDAYMLTHYHSDHIGTFKRLTRVYRIERLYLPVPETQNEQRFYNELIKLTGYTEIVMYKRGDAVEFGAATVSTVPYTLLERSEHPVIAIKIIFGDNSLLYLGASAAESDAVPQVEVMIRDTSAVICGRHGPVTKESSPYLWYSSDTEVYLSPYEDTDELITFPNGSFKYIEADVEGIAKARFVLAE